MGRHYKEEANRIDRNTAYIGLALLYGVALMAAVFVYRRSDAVTTIWAIVLMLFFGAGESGRKKWLGENKL